MTTRRAAPITDDVLAAIAKFFHAGHGPSHSEISRVLTGTGHGDGYTYTPGVQGPNKEQRILQGLALAKRQPARARDLLDGLLSLLRVNALIGPTATGEDVDRLKRALSSAGWYLTQDGHAQPFGQVDLDTGGRAAPDEQVARLRRSTGDPALLIGTAKELLETVSTFVLEEAGYAGSDKMEYNQLWHLARERLGVLPQQVDPNVPGANAIRAIHLKHGRPSQQTPNLQGHGRTLPTGGSQDRAISSYAKPPQSPTTSSSVVPPESWRILYAASRKGPRHSRS